MQPTKTLRELLDEACSLVRRYKSPNIDEFKERMDEVLIAANLGCIDNDTVISIDEYDDFVSIEISYTLRQCSQTENVSFPSFLIDAPDPVLAAKKWGYDNAVKELEDTLKFHEWKVENTRDQLTKLKELYL